MRSDKNLGILGAFAAGVLLGILFAPDKGSATRKRIRKNGMGLIDSLKFGYYELEDKVSDLVPEKTQHLEGKDDETAPIKI